MFVNKPKPNTEEQSLVNFENLSYKDVEKSLLEKKYLVNEISKDTIIYLNSTINEEIPKYKDSISNILKYIEEEKEELNKIKNKISKQEYRNRLKELEKEKLEIQDKFKKFVLDYFKPLNIDSSDIKNSFYYIELFKKYEEDNLNLLKQDSITIKTKKVEKKEFKDDLTNYI